MAVDHRILNTLRWFNERTMSETSKGWREWLPTNTCMLVRGGSDAYGASLSPTQTDFDVFGFALPPRRDLYLSGVHHWDKHKPWAQFHQTNMVHENGSNYDWTIYHIGKFFSQLCTGNFNTVELLYARPENQLYIGPIGVELMKHRDMFLTQKMARQFQEYGVSQRNKLSRKPKGGRVKLVSQHGYDVKFAYHCIRSVLEVIQVAETGTLVLNQNAELLKSIRRGDFTLEQIYDMFNEYNARAIKSVNQSELPTTIDRDQADELLHALIAMHYEGTTPRKVTASDVRLKQLTSKMYDLLSEYQ